MAVQTNGFGSSLWAPQVVLDRGDQVGDAVEHASADGFVGQVAKPTFHEVQPGRGGRGEVQVEAGVLGEPGFDVVVAVGSVVVDDHVDLQRPWHRTCRWCAESAGTRRGGAGRSTARSRSR